MRFTAYVIPLLLSSLIMAFLSVRAWMARPSIGRVATIMGLLTATIGAWSLLYAVETSMPDYALKVMFARWRFVAAVATPVIWFWLAVFIAKRYHWVRPTWLALSLLLPAFSVLVYWTNDLHYLFFLSASLVEYDQFSLLVTTKGPWYTINLVVCYAMVTIGVLLVSIANRQAFRRYRWQGVILYISLGLVVIFPLLYAGGLVPIDYTSAALSIPVVLVGWAVLRLQLDIAVPIARTVVVENMVDPVLVSNPDGIVVDVNHAAQALFGDSKPLQGARLSEVLPTLAGTMREAEAALAAQASPDVTIRTQQGTRVFNIQSSLLQGYGGIRYGHVTILHDVTLEKQNELRILQQNIELISSNQALLKAREAAEAASKLKSDFLATMSHELRTPIHTIMGYTDLLIETLQETGILTDSQQDIHQRIMHSNERLLGLIDGILDMSRIEAGRMLLQYQTISTQLWIDAIRLEIQPQLARKGLAFDVSVDPLMPTYFRTDTTRLRQLTMNLLSNALKFTSEGRVSLSMRQIRTSEANPPASPTSEQMIEISITDTGIGIATEHHQAIFDNFYQIDGGVTRRYGGIGLGLAIVHKLVEIMGGQVFVESAPDRGSTFTIRLPLNNDTDATDDTTNDTPATTPP